MQVYPPVLHDVRQRIPPRILHFGGQPLARHKVKTRAFPSTVNCVPMPAVIASELG